MVSAFVEPCEHIVEIVDRNVLDRVLFVGFLNRLMM